MTDDFSDALLFAAGKLRLCVTCGKLVDAEKVKRGDDLPECRSILDGVEVATCTFDLTPQEAIEYWRSEAATLRAEVERLREALTEIAAFNDIWANDDKDAALRKRAALAALKGLLANEAAFGATFYKHTQGIAEASVAIADALVARLKEVK